MVQPGTLQQHTPDVTVLNETAKGEPLTDSPKTLTQEYLRIIGFARWLNGDRARLAIHDMSEKTKISKDKIRQIRDKAHQRLRATQPPWAINAL